MGIPLDCKVWSVSCSMAVKVVDQHRGQDDLLEREQLVNHGGEV